MTVIEDTLKLAKERWDDPGVYPSGAGSCALASYWYVEGVTGKLVIQADAIDYDELKDCYYLDGVVVTAWDVRQSDGQSVLTAREFNAEGWVP